MKIVEISLKGLLFYILKHWKSVLFAMIIGGAILNSYYVISNKNTSIDTSTNVSHGISLSDSEKAYVESVYNYLQSLRQLNEYQKQSLLMRINPQDFFKAELTYMISVENPDSMEGAEQAFADCLTSSDIINFLSDKTGMNNSDIEDVVTVIDEINREESTSTVFSVTIISDDRTNVELMADAFASFVIDKNSYFQRLGLDYELIEIRKNIYHVSDNMVQSVQNQILQDIQTRSKSILDTENTLKDSQKAYYEELLSAEETNEESDQLANETLGSPDSISYPFVSKKFLLIGLIAGMVIMTGIWFLVYVLGNKLDTEDDVERTYGLFLFGVIPSDEYGSILYRVMNFRKRSFNPEESTKLIATRIKVNLEKNGINQLGIIGNDIQKYTKNEAEKLAEYLKKEGIKAEVIDNPLYDANSLNKLDSIEHVVLMEKKNETIRTEIWKESELAKKMGIIVDGMIIVG